MTRPCHFCGREINPDGPNTYRRIHGWERKASTWGSRKGGSDIALREPSEEVACGFCIDNLKNGRAANQGALI